LALFEKIQLIGKIVSLPAWFKAMSVGVDSFESILSKDNVSPPILPTSRNFLVFMPPPDSLTRHIRNLRDFCDGVKLCL
jgi:hypothetical protein